MRKKWKLNPPWTKLTKTQKKERREGRKEIDSSEYSFRNKESQQCGKKNVFGKVHAQKQAELGGH